MDVSSLRIANEKLKISDDLSNAKNRHIIFVYCPIKVGSTSLVSSLRIGTLGNVKVCHIHSENCIRTLHGIENVSVKDIIQYNKSLGKKVTVIDVYRNPIEHKMSVYFELLSSYHFNNTEDRVKDYPVDKIIQRFNSLFPHLCNDDYYREKYGLPFYSIPGQFDYDKKCISTIWNGVTYIKLRLEDSAHWSGIIHSILGFKFVMVKDYETESKQIHDLYRRFKEQYRVPKNFIDILRNDASVQYYLSPTEKEQYLQTWTIKSGDYVEPYTAHEYRIYTEISLSNKYISDVHHSHYKDEGCICYGCCTKRKTVFQKLLRGENTDEKIQHFQCVDEYKSNLNKKIHEKLKKVVRPAKKTAQRVVGMKII